MEKEGRIFLKSRLSPLWRAWRKPLKTLRKPLRIKIFFFPQVHNLASMESFKKAILKLWIILPQIFVTASVSTGWRRNPSKNLKEFLWNLLSRAHQSITTPLKKAKKQCLFGECTFFCYIQWLFLCASVPQLCKKEGKKKWQVKNWKTLKLKLD